MKVQNFEIKVALLGHVSVGKTTVLNALFQDKFSEVSMRRTTAGINHFRVSSEKKEKIAKNEEQISTKWDTDDDIEVKFPAEVLSQIVHDNKVLRERNQIQETVFDIKLDESIFEMRNDTKLIVTDIPGINEAHTSVKYIDYINKSWDTFDCVVVVMDAFQGVNTEEQVKLLKLVQTNLKNLRKIPAIVLCNKVDEPEDTEIQALVNEIRDEVESTFNAPNREDALINILSSTSHMKKRVKGPNKRVHSFIDSPAFIPISAENAFLYRAASRLPIEEFKNFNKEYVDKIGKDEFGKFKWKSFSQKKKYEEVYSIVSDAKQYKERIAASNFDKFLRVLEYFIGGNENQINLIESQMNISIEKLSIESEIADQLNEIYDRCKVLGKPTNHLKDKFWTLFSQCKLESYKKLLESPSNIKYSQKPMYELVQYASGLHKKLHATTSSQFKPQDKIDDERKIVESMKGIVKQIIKVVLEKSPKASSWNYNLPRPRTSANYDDQYWKWDGNTWYNNRTGACNYDNKKHPAGNRESHWSWNNETKKWYHVNTGFTKDGVESVNPAKAEAAELVECSWDVISPFDVNRILTSILIMAYDKYFCLNFTKDIADLEWVRQKPVEGVQIWDKIQEYTQGSYVRGEFVPNKPLEYKHTAHVEIPEYIESHDHWGHVIWIFCEFMKSKKVSTNEKKSM